MAEENFGNISTIIRSIKPIKYLFSKESRDFEKYFRGPNLKSLLKTLNTKPKVHDFFISNYNNHKQNNNNKNNFIEVNLKSTLNHIENLSNFKYLPSNLMNKLQDKEKNENCIEYYNYKNKPKKLKLNKNKKKSSSAKQVNIFINQTSDPGRYDPNYDLVKKRIPVAYIKSSKEELKNLKQTKSKSQNNFFLKNKNINNEKSYLINSINNLDIKNNCKDKNKDNITSRKKTFNFRRMFKKKSTINDFENDHTYKHLKFLHDHQKKLSSAQISFSKNKNNSNNKNILSNLSSPKKNKTSVNFYKKLDINKNDEKKEDDSLLKDKYLSPNPHLNKCLIDFEKMSGRDRKLNIYPVSYSKSTYSPKYEITRPRIHSPIFKFKSSFQDYKKYVTGKLIRSYCFAQFDYFVMDINKNKKCDDLNGNYRHVINLV